MPGLCSSSSRPSWCLKASLRLPSWSGTGRLLPGAYRKPRHATSRRSSTSTKTSRQPKARKKSLTLRATRLGLKMEVLPPGDLPPPRPKPYFALLDRALVQRVAAQRSIAVLDRYDRRSPRMLRSKSSTRTRFCASLRPAARPTLRTRISFFCGWSARRSFC